MARIKQGGLDRKTGSKTWLHMDFLSGARHRSILPISWDSQDVYISHHLHV
jgi:hypothetical protein